MAHTFCKNIVAALLGAFLLLGGSTMAQAQDNYQARRHCEHRIRRAEANLHRAIARHGEHSRQAEQRRRQLEEVRERCRGQL